MTSKSPSQRYHRRSLLLSGLIIIVFLLIIYWLAGVLFPFAIGGVLAYILFPIVKVLERAMPWREERPTLSRIIAIALVFVVALGAIAGAMVLVIPQIVNEVTVFISNLPEFFQAAQATIEQLNREYAERIPEEIKQIYGRDWRTPLISSSGPFRTLFKSGRIYNQCF
jgi:predicted PurR-regulated permease PerM